MQIYEIICSLVTFQNNTSNEILHPLLHIRRQKRSLPQLVLSAGHAYAGHLLTTRMGQVKFIYRQKETGLHLSSNCSAK